MPQSRPLKIDTVTPSDCAALAVMNRQLIDEGQQTNTMTVPELERRMRDWFHDGVYSGYVFRLNGEIIGRDEMYVRRP